jgi:hypothetical protein
MMKNEPKQIMCPIRLKGLLTQKRSIRKVRAVHCTNMQVTSLRNAVLAVWRFEPDRGLKVCNIGIGYLAVGFRD